MIPHIHWLLTRTKTSTYQALHQWSLDHPEAFWDLVREYAQLPPRHAPFNFAELLLRHAHHTPALIYRNELGQRIEWSGQQLRDATASYAAFLRERGIATGDRVAAFLPNRPETIALMLAVASIGAIWSSCSPDFGTPAVRDRFTQIEPKLLFTTKAYSFNGKPQDLTPRNQELSQHFATIDIDDIPLLPNLPLAFSRLPPQHPLFILFSSGTTGLPKCIVHSAGGTLTQIVKEHLFHVDLHPGERLFYYTTCGWMMWNWLAVGLATGATLILYDGSPFYPGPQVLWNLAEQERVQHFGTSAKYLSLLEKHGYHPNAHHHLSHLRQVLSTGSPLLPSSFDFVGQRIGTHIHLASISGGTDIISCFVLGCPILPVHRGEIQVPGLGMDVQIWNEAGQRIYDQPGELICRNAFPSMPLGFWGDPDGSRYRAAYFEHFPNTWRHGDWALQNSQTLGFTIYGRSDSTLNPGGVRIGTAEIYRLLEDFPGVAESIVVGHQQDGDERIILFVKLSPGALLDDTLRDQLRRHIRANASPHHVPKEIIAVSDIPRTINGKISEAAARAALHNRPVPNLQSLANPQCLAEFQLSSETRKGSEAL
jgi:acetoacetyl-CoA synthetase